MSADNNSASGTLIQAAKSGDADGVAAALRAGADKDAKDPEWPNCTALLISAHNGHKKIVITLLNAGVNVDARQDERLSALHLCCLSGHKDVAYILIGGGANINATDFDGLTPLMLASERGQDNLVVCLLDDAGADAGFKDNSGNTSMHYACSEGHCSVVNILTQHGADVKIKAKDGRQPIHIAAYGGHDKTVSTLIQLGADVNCTDNQGKTPLFMATQEEYGDVVNTLSKNGAHSNVTIKSIQTSKKHQCAVCLKHRTTTFMILPCRHTKTCQDCMEARGDNRCPVCQAEITQRIPTFD